MRVIPAIDLKDGKCVRLRQGHFDDKKVYSADPVSVARNYEACGFTHLHIIDLDGAETGESQNAKVVQQILKVCKMKVQLGGGIRKYDHIEQWLGLGLDNVIVSTLAIREPKTLQKALDDFGEGIILAVDARDGHVVISGWQEMTNYTAVELALQFKPFGLRRVLYTDIARDGMFTGPNIEQTKNLAVETGLAVTASGGVASMADIENLRALTDFGVDSVVVGKAFYEGRITPEEVFNAG